MSAEYLDLCIQALEHWSIFEHIWNDHVSASWTTNTINAKEGYQKTFAEL